MTRRVFILAHDEARRRAQDECGIAPEGWMVTFTAPKKSREQEEKYHAMLGDIAKQVPLHGRLRDEETVKRLCIDQFYRDTKDDVAFRDAWIGMGELAHLPSIDGTGVVSIGWQSRSFPKVLASGFVEWLYALGAENGVRWSDPKVRRERIDADTGEITEVSA